MYTDFAQEFEGVIKFFQEGIRKAENILKTLMKNHDTDDLGQEETHAENSNPNNEQEVSFDSCMVEMKASILALRSE